MKCVKVYKTSRMDRATHIIRVSDDVAYELVVGNPDKYEYAPKHLYKTQLKKGDN